ncbi:hypothetical protein BCE75_11186 [Isoptericola sp. CG 20/1183]|uniref:Excreted virulence factor EspC (Type VII ESX diderm) n=1 Tax=Isoptericola halotolerans TaxID=300560 RepID=A0ABX5EHW2_9MICO|nr:MULTISPECIES: hypothetical protein [Isoptericola]MCK0118523.1 hypothetical protein [Isoptericola sp. S6320L]PRZ04165.1 hypothetical protein BCE75_11186 [Isoptericola sp. CG 20/1183]PRZ10010.1 hypothetical protein BCL65_101148 [Isoptericola halotolerans]
MAHIDIDTAELAAAGGRAGDTAALLAGLTTERVTAHGAAEAAGEPVLAAAIEDLLAAWAPVHRSLVSALEGLAEGLRQAAAVYESADAGTADVLARMVLSSARGEPARGPAAGPLADREV